MSPERVVAAVHDMLMIELMLAAPLLLTAILTSILVGLLQAGMRVNDMTLSFVPRFAAVLLALYFTASWAVTLMIGYVERSAAAIRSFSG
jgi:flagellar biosynthesis protein FliQ